MVKTVTKDRIFLSPPHMSGTEMKYINEAIKTNWIAPLGPNVDAFEREIAQFAGVKGAVAVSSGTAAIHLALTLLDVEKGDIVFCSSLTFIASANPIKYLGAEPVFIDSERETWNMSPVALRSALLDAALAGKLPKAVIIVNLYGQSAKIEELVSICNDFHVPVIEDAAESLGALYKGKASGTFGEFGVYSFNGNKIITTSGGGMLISNNIEALNRAKFLATQAKDPAPYYQHSVMGYNYRMSNILAGIGRSQLEALHERVKARRAIFEIYQEELGSIPIVSFMPELQNTFSTRWLTIMTLNEEAEVSIEELISNLEQNNIEARHVWKPLHMQPLFNKNKFYQHQNKSVSEELFQSGICLPSGSNMTNYDQMRVVKCIRNMLVG